MTQPQDSIAANVLEHWTDMRQLACAGAMTMMCRPAISLKSWDVRRAMLTRVKRLRKLRGRPLQHPEPVSLTCTHQIFRVLLSMECAAERYTDGHASSAFCNMSYQTSSMCGEDRTSIPAAPSFLQGVLGPKQPEAGVALESLAQLRNEHLCPVVQHGIEALQDALACHKHAGQSGHACTSLRLRDRLRVLGAR